MAIKILSVPQLDGAIQYLAFTADDAEDIRRDGALIFYRPALASLVVYEDGQRIWDSPGKPRGRAAILEHLQDLDDADADREDDDSEEDDDS